MPEALRHRIKAFLLYRDCHHGRRCTAPEQMHTAHLTGLGVFYYTRFLPWVYDRKDWR